MGVWLKPTFHATPLPLCHETSVCTLKAALSSVNHSLALGERVAAGRVRVNPRELLPKMSKLEPPVFESPSSLCSWCLGGDFIIFGFWVTSYAERGCYRTSDRGARRPIPSKQDKPVLISFPFLQNLFCRQCRWLGDSQDGIH